MSNMLCITCNVYELAEYLIICGFTLRIPSVSSNVNTLILCNSLKIVKAEFKYSADVLTIYNSDKDDWKSCFDYLSVVGLKGIR